MQGLVGFVGPEGALQIFGVRMVGITAANGRKLLLTLAFVAAIWLLGRLLRWLVRRALRGREDVRAQFWSRQAVQILTTLLLILALVSIWFDQPSRLGTAAGLVTAGLAVALQRVVTAVAAYFAILRGKVFNVGDRIVMGGVRGDVVALGYVRTTIMEMGEAPPEQSADPAMWVEGRQYTGRIVTITNDKIFDTPVYNFTRDFPYIWEELHLPVSYKDDRARAERILLDVAGRHTVPIAELAEPALRALEHRFYMKPADVHPKVYYKLTDNWLELSVRFLARPHGARDLKDAMSREILAGLDAAGIGIASATYDIVGLPPVEVEIRKP